jgi:hypothetical protein
MQFIRKGVNLKMYSGAGSKFENSTRPGDSVRITIVSSGLLALTICRFGVLSCVSCYERSCCDCKYEMQLQLVPSDAPQTWLLHMPVPAAFILSPATTLATYHVRLVLAEKLGLEAQTVQNGVQGWLRHRLRHFPMARCYSCRICTMQNTRKTCTPGFPLGLITLSLSTLSCPATANARH